MYGLEENNERLVKGMETQVAGLGLVLILLMPVVVAAAAVALNQFIAVVAPGEENLP